jgi:hypothetical protein
MSVTAFKKYNGWTSLNFMNTEATHTHTHAHAHALALAHVHARARTRYGGKAPYLWGGGAIFIWRLCCCSRKSSLEVTRRLIRVTIDYNSGRKICWAPSNKIRNVMWLINSIKCSHPWELKISENVIKFVAFFGIRQFFLSSLMPATGSSLEPD